MEVDRTNSAPAVPIDASRLVEARAAREAARAPSSAPGAVRHDAVELSDEAKQIIRFSTAASASSDRAELVAELKARIDTGEYDVDFEALATELIDRGEA